MDLQPTSIELSADKTQKASSLWITTIISFAINIGVVAYLYTIEKDVMTPTMLAFVAISLFALQVFSTILMFRAFQNRVIRLTIDRQSLFIVRRRDEQVGSSGTPIPLDPSAPLTANILRGKGKKDLYLRYADPTGKKHTLMLDGYAYSEANLQRLKDWVDARASTSTN